MSTPDLEDDGSEIPLREREHDHLWDLPDDVPGCDPVPAPNQPESVESLAQQRSVDVEVFAAMERIDFDPEHRLGRAYAGTLRETGRGELVQLDRYRQLRPRASRLGSPLPPPPPCWASEAPSLIFEAAFAAAPQFIAKKLREWRPDGGASPHTWWVNYLIKGQFATRYRALWRRERKITLRELGIDDNTLVDRPGPADELVDAVLDQVMVAQAREPMSPRLHVVANLLGEGKSQRAAAGAVGVDPQTVRRDLRRLREELRKRHGWTTEDGA